MKALYVDSRSATLNLTSTNARSDTPFNGSSSA
jgi:hypothetical protein